jgi:dolichol-phosphate mannosyltransferase
MSETLIIIPTYNERENARAIAQAVLDSSPDVNILFVDDNSPDGTGPIIDGLVAADERIHVLHRKEKDGLGRAYIAGFKWALEREYEFVFEMDADFSHDPKAIPQFIEAARDVDLVLGSRYIGGIRIMNWPLSRLMLSKGAGLYVRIITGMPLTDPTGGFKCFRRRVLEAIDLDQIQSNGYSFQIEMTHKAWMKGFKIFETPIVFEERRSGESKMSKGIVFEALSEVWRLLFSARCRRRPPAQPTA